MDREKNIEVSDSSSLLPLVDLLQETREHRPLHAALLLRYLLDQLTQPAVHVLLVLLVLLTHADGLEHGLHSALAFGVLLSVVGVEHCALRRRRERESSVDAPRALVVDDVRPDLTQDLRRRGEIEEVVLDLEVLAEREEDLERGLVGLGQVIAGF